MRYMVTPFSHLKSLARQRTPLVPPTRFSSLARSECSTPSLAAVMSGISFKIAAPARSSAPPSRPASRNQQQQRQQATADDSDSDDDDFTTTKRRREQDELVTGFDSKGASMYVSSLRARVLRGGRQLTHPSMWATGNTEKSSKHLW